MAESTLDTITVGSWTLSEGYVTDDGVYVLNLGGSFNANDCVFTTLDDDETVYGSINLVSIPAGGAPQSVDNESPVEEDVPVDLSWVFLANGLYTVNINVVTLSEFHIMESASVTLRVRSWTEAELDAEAHTEATKAADASTESQKAADSSTEKQKAADTSTETSKSADAWTEPTGG